MSRLYLKIPYGETKQVWREAVLDDKDDVRFTFTFDNLENPTNYVSERSVSVKLPRCADNDKLFSNICRLDSVVTASGFNPAEKMQYLAMASGMVVSTGDAVLTKVDKDAYYLSLTGSQSAIFSRLLNAGYSAAKKAEDDSYVKLFDVVRYAWLNGYDMNAKNALNAALVRTSWMVDNPLFDLTEIYQHNDLAALYGLASAYETAAHIVSLIGFAPTLQGAYPDFSGDKWLNKTVIDGKRAAQAGIVPVLSQRTWLDGSAADSYKVEGTIYEQQLGEYRSYYQQPYIYVSALWQLIARECRTITGYEMILDQRWFNAANDELKGMVYMLPQQKIDEKTLAESALSGGLTATVMPIESAEVSQSPIIVSGIGDVVATATTDAVHVEAGERVTFGYDLESVISMLPHYNLPYHYVGMNNVSPLHIIVKATGAGVGFYNEKHYIILNTTEKSGKDWFLDRNTIFGNKVSQAVGKAMRRAYEIRECSYSPIAVDVQGDMTLAAFHDELTLIPTTATDIRLEVTASFYTTEEETPFALAGYDVVSSNYWYDVDTAPTLSVGISNVTVRRAENMRSGRAVSLEALFGDMAPFSVLLQYAKLHHLVWEVDDVAETVTVKRSKDAFADFMAANPADITSQVAQAVTMTPLSWEHRSVLFNLEGLDTTFTEGYEERHGIPFGSKRIVTQNAVDKGEKKLITNYGSKASAVASLTGAPVRAIMASDTTTQVESLPAIANVKDDKAANISGNFYYRRANRTAAEPLLDGWRSMVYVSDDSIDEVLRNTFCWHGDSASDMPLAVIPVFATVAASGQSVLFAPVREAYSSTPDVATQYLYERAWQSYVEELYNVQNKTIEVNIDLPRDLFDEVRRVPLVIIDHLLYLVTEIRSWGEHNTTCRCKLRQINNINNLIS